MTNTFRTSVLDNWITEKLNLPKTDTGCSRRILEDWQLSRLCSLIDCARSSSPFYKKTLSALPLPQSWQDFTAYPFTDAQILRTNGLKLLCVSQGDISRIVTLRTSGTDSAPKRVFFTKEDQELCIDFFHHGMAELVNPGETALVLLPYQTEGSVGDLLISGLQRLGVHPEGYGIIHNLKDCADTIQRLHAACAVGIPVQMLALADYCRQSGRTLPLKKVLLSTDCLPQALRRRIEQELGCQVYNHFGMTETGLGGALECGVHQGMHLRENDLLGEIIDPDTLQPLPHGQWGELVITTLTRNGMPLIRYRTGDLARILPEPCPCGSFLKRIEHRGRLNSQLLTQLDEILFSLPDITDYQCLYSNKGDSLEIMLHYLEGNPPPDTAAVTVLLQDSPALGGAAQVSVSCKSLSPLSLPYTGKRSPCQILS